MIIFSTKIFSNGSKRKEILEIFSNVKGPIEAKGGCISTRIYRVHSDENQIVYQEVWRNRKVQMQSPKLQTGSYWIYS